MLVLAPEVNGGVDGVAFDSEGHGLVLAVAEGGALGREAVGANVLDLDPGGVGEQGFFLENQCDGGVAVGFDDLGVGIGQFCAGVDSGEDGKNQKRDELEL